MRFAFCPTRPAYPLNWLLALALNGAALIAGAPAAANPPDSHRAGASSRASVVGKASKSRQTTQSAKSAKSPKSPKSPKSDKSAKRTPPTRPAKAAAPRQGLKSAASDLALASATAEAINDAQLGIAARVLTGDADCEFNQRISVLPDTDQPGYFRVAYKNLRYWMVPRETSTGAVRLEDAAAGVVWLQIPTKSMLMNARIGQRLVDACTHAEQRAALAAVADAASALGLLPSAAAAPAPASALSGCPGAPHPTTELMTAAAAANLAANAAAAVAAIPLAAPPGAPLPPLPPADSPTQVKPEAVKTQEASG